MKASLEWLSEWVEIHDSASATADALTMLGLEVDAVVDQAAGLDGVVVARVDSVESHPQADRLKVCAVFDGNAVHQIVCGAPNVTAGVVVPLIRPGSRLPDGTKIKSAKLRGVKSDGMLCSGRELGLTDDSSGLMLLDHDAEVGALLIEHLALNDFVIDVDLTPNRGDCFSIMGIAREIAAKQGKSLNGPSPISVKPKSQDVLAVNLDAGAACPMFYTRLIKNIDNTRKSPRWLTERLRRAGIRAINPVVDVTNYVMLERGQPLHAYDLSKLAAPISVRFAQASEQLALLNDNSIELNDDTLVIADQAGAIGLAGIMGGSRTAVSADSQDVLLESAWFAPDAVAGRARAYGLHTDASVRFERGVDPAGQLAAIERATSLLLEIVGGEPGLVQKEQNDHLPASPDVISLRLQRATEVLGIDLDPKEVEVMLNKLGIALEAQDFGWVATVPTYRFDLRIEADLVEEIGRMLGYDQIPAMPGESETHLGLSSERKLSIATLADVLVNRGYNEIISYSFIDAEIDEKFSPKQSRIELVNPISKDLGVMRSSLWPGLVNVATKNRAYQIEDLRLCEIGPKFDSNLDQSLVVAGLATGMQVIGEVSTERKTIDFYDVKADVETLLSMSDVRAEIRFEASNHPALHPAQTAEILAGDTHIGWLGALHPSIHKQLDFRDSVYLFELNFDLIDKTSVPAFKAFSNFPFIRRDIAVVVPEAVTAGEVVEVVRRSAGPLLQDVIVFDLYRGKGVDATAKSIALGLILQDTSRTLTDGDADGLVSLVTESLGSDLGALIRT